MKPIAVIDYSVDGKSGALIKSWLSGPTKVIFVKDGSPFPEILPADFRAIIHSGSSHSIVATTSFIQEARKLVKSAIAANVPQMGICYGHQLLALATVGERGVARSKSIEVGWEEVNFLDSWPSEEVSGFCKVWQSHYDCVVEIPEGSQVIASNNHTAIQAFINKDLRLFGTQFHPEFNMENGNKAFRDDLQTLEKNGVSLAKALTSELEPVPGSFIFTDFLKMYGVE